MKRQTGICSHLHHAGGPLLAAVGLLLQTQAALRAPAIPLVAHDPYFSIWCAGDRLTDVDTTHWTGKPHRLTGVVTIDGQAYRVLGATPADLPALPQTGLRITPTRTMATFAGAGVELHLTFLTPALPEDIDILSRPVTYLIWECHSTDGRLHEVAFALSASAELAVNLPDQQVLTRLERWGDLAVFRVGSEEQPILAKSGDDIRIDWGYFHLAGSDGARVRWIEGPDERTVSLPEGRTAWVESQRALPAAQVRGELRWPAIRVGEQPVSRWLMLAYDDLYSIQYLGHNLRPYWRRHGWEARDLLEAAARDFAELRRRCEAFDAELTADLERAGGVEYAEIATLAYRQCFAAGKFVADANGQPLSFCKENHSNGCIATSDVFYPMAPQFLLFGPSLTKSFLVPFMNYAASERWRFPFAPHDLGTYPHANGQRYGGGEHSEENQMPVEESGNLLILMTALAEMEGNADFASLYWPQLTRWAEYLREKGFDPENQLCTDDFAGHLAHNVNLSAKAICGLAGYARLCELRGETARAREYRELARRFVGQWLEAADDGDHYRLAFDKPGTWSQKYNIVWDRILGFDLWPDAVLHKEMDFYKRVQQPYGLPLDNRSLYTKLDWILWTATLTGDRADFDALVHPVWKFLNETPDRVPMTDWYWTHNARRRGFTARPVVGGVFLRMLYDKAVWKKYASRDRTRSGGFAPAPKPPRIVPVVPAADRQPVLWRYTTTQPPADWTRPDFDDSGWAEGQSGFGTRGTPGAVVGTVWNTPEIWLRRVIEIPAGIEGPLQFWIHHDEDAEVYLDGRRVLRTTSYTTGYTLRAPSPRARDLLRPGRHVLAVHCRQTGGGQYIDVGLVEVQPAD
ncbi:MAG: DUF4965 domain-containing protein [Verrucomicrobia bacterium]|nr:MAG: DUF4965 domain-containing protein [Verrucomicrobiota bacterium]